MVRTTPDKRVDVSTIAISRFGWAGESETRPPHRQRRGDPLTEPTPAKVGTIILQLAGMSFADGAQFDLLPEVVR